MEIRKIILAMSVLLLSYCHAVAWRSMEVLLYDNNVYTVQFTDSLTMRFTPDELLFTDGNAASLAIPLEYLGGLLMSDSFVGDDDEDDDEKPDEEGGGTTTSITDSKVVLFSFDGDRLILGDEPDTVDVMLFTAAGRPATFRKDGNVIYLNGLAPGVYVLRIEQSEFKIVVR